MTWNSQLVWRYIKVASELLILFMASAVKVKRRKGNKLGEKGCKTFFHATSNIDDGKQTKKNQKASGGNPNLRKTQNKASSFYGWKFLRGKRAGKKLSRAIVLNLKATGINTLWVLINLLTDSAKKSFTTAKMSLKRTAKAAKVLTLCVMCGEGSSNLTLVEV